MRSVCFPVLSAVLFLVPSALWGQCNHGGGGGGRGHHHGGPPSLGNFMPPNFAFNLGNLPNFAFNLNVNMPGLQGNPRAPMNPLGPNLAFQNPFNQQPGMQNPVAGPPLVPNQLNNQQPGLQNPVAGAPGLRQPMDQSSVTSMRALNESYALLVGLEQKLRKQRLSTATLQPLRRDLQQMQQAVSARSATLAQKQAGALQGLQSAISDLQAIQDSNQPTAVQTLLASSLQTLQQLAQTSQQAVQTQMAAGF